ncbi:hypothetical protein V6N12_003811 [Hibiscus sabdariffa]|uniref:Uncharacterized protein n=1 Tax=Hibiscus sabdariffa TaxID=183260 RepID=A0ABR2CJN1_9ROSI
MRTIPFWRQSHRNKYFPDKDGGCHHVGPISPSVVRNFMLRHFIGNDGGSRMDYSTMGSIPLVFVDTFTARRHFLSTTTLSPPSHSNPTADF